MDTRRKTAPIATTVSGIESNPECPLIMVMYLDCRLAQHESRARSMT
jgi:hypothetical protein